MLASFGDRAILGSFWSGVSAIDRQRALVLQGGGALGAYQAGAYAALAREGEHPDRIAGVSIGAINGAIIAGNAPERRVERLETFWRRVTSATDWPYWQPQGQAGAWLTAMLGAPGFFRLRAPLGFMSADANAASFYDTAPLRETLNELVDFDLLNSGAVRFSVGAVDIETGDYARFDTAEIKITAEHVMASGALPPGFPAIPINGRHFWDGGIISNTPLQDVLATRDQIGPLTIWQIDLFPARGRAPRTIWEIEGREKDLRFSSRTRAVTDRVRERHDLATSLKRWHRELPVALRSDPLVTRLLAEADFGPIGVVHLIYRNKRFEAGGKDYEFSHAAMAAHWAAGENDVRRTLAHPVWRTHNHAAEAITVFDLGAQDEGQADE